MNKLIGHRGFSSFEVDNSKESVMALEDLPYVFAIEVDIRLTKDKRLVAIHDQNVNFVSNGSGIVEESSYLYLRTLWFHENYIDMFKLYSKSFRLKDGKIIRERLRDKTKKKVRLYLIEDLIKASTKNFVVEIKCSKDYSEILEHSLDFIKKNKKRIVVKSFNAKFIEDLKEKLNGSVEVGIIISKNKHLKNLNSSADFYSIKSDIITKDMVTTLRKSNKRIMVWSINTFESLVSLQTKLEGEFKYVEIITNYPDLIYNYLKGDNK